PQDDSRAQDDIGRWSILREPQDDIEPQDGMGGLGWSWLLEFRKRLSVNATTSSKTAVLNCRPGNGRGHRIDWLVFIKGGARLNITFDSPSNLSYLFELGSDNQRILITRIFIARI